MFEIKTIGEQAADGPQGTFVEACIEILSAIVWLSICGWVIWRAIRQLGAIL